MPWQVLRVAEAAGRAPGAVRTILNAVELGFCDRTASHDIVRATAVIV